MKLKPRFTAGDLIRVPVGLLFMWMSVSAWIKAYQSFEPSAVSVVVTVLTVAVGIVFIGIGFVMAFGWLLDGGAAKTKRDD